MAEVTLVGYALCVVVAVAAVWLLTRRRSRRTDPLAPPARSLLDAARRRALIAVLFSGVVMVALLSAGYFLPNLAGLTPALAPALGGAAGLLLYSATPPRVIAVESDAERQASLTPRTPLSFVPRLGAGFVGLVAIAQIVFLVFTGATSSPDELGRFKVITFQLRDIVSVGGPYAGWFYAVPLLVTTAILVTATLLALWRVSSAPALPQRELATVDAGWRRASTRIIVAISGAALLLQFGGVALQSGLSIRNTYFDGVPAGWDTIGQLFLGGGFVMLIGSVAGLTLAALWALTLRDLARNERRPTLTRSGKPTHERIAR